MPRVTQLACARACPQTWVPDCRTRRLPWLAGDSQAGSLLGMPTSGGSPRMPVTRRSCPLACPKGESGFASVFPFLGTIWQWRFWEPWACLYLSCRFSELSGPPVGLTPPLSALLDEAPGLCAVRWPRVDVQHVSEGWEGGGRGYPLSRCPPGPEWGRSEAVGRGDWALTLKTIASQTFGRCPKTPKQARPFCRLQHSQDSPFCSVPKPNPSIIPRACGVDREPRVFLHGACCRHHWMSEGP